MRNRHWISVALFILMFSSCNLPDEQPTDPPLASRTPTLDAPTPGVSTLTPIPIETLLTIESPTITPTATPRVALASPKDQPVNCRFGPDISYAVVGALNLGRLAEIVGRNPDSTWFYVRNPSNPSTFCWLSADFIETEGDVASLPVVGPPEITVTSIKVSIEPPAMNVACEAFPQSVIISAQISTNGPAIVVWHWESSAGKSSAEKELLFEEAGSKIVQDFYQVDGVNDYVLQVKTTLPNLFTGQANFKITCTP